MNDLLVFVPAFFCFCEALLGGFSLNVIETGARPMSWILIPQFKKQCSNFLISVFAQESLRFLINLFLYDLLMGIRMSLLS